jgi:hypothetical protein
MFGVPAEAKDVTIELLQEVMPPDEIIAKWFRGEDADWPPEPEAPELRFDVGTKVQCRVGPSEWESGTVIQLWYRENSWPEGVYAPYKIRLNIGKDIYAPQDTDKMIRLDPTIAANNAAPISD